MYVLRMAGLLSGYLTFCGQILSSTVFILVNPLLNATASNALLQPLKDLVTTELNGTWTFKTEPSYLSMYNDFITKVAPVRNLLQTIKS